MTKHKITKPLSEITMKTENTKIKDNEQREYLNNKITLNIPPRKWKH